MMRTATVLLLLACTAFAQTQTDQDQNQDQNQNQDQKQNQEQPQHSTVDVKPGPPVIKEKDIWNETGFFHPFVRMPKYLLQDQKAIWTSPFHTTRKDAKYWAIFGAARSPLSRAAAESPLAIAMSPANLVTAPTSV